MNKKLIIGLILLGLAIVIVIFVKMQPDTQPRQNNPTPTNNQYQLNR